MPRLTLTLRTRFFLIVWPLVVAATVGVGWYFGRWTRVEIRRTLDLSGGGEVPAWAADSAAALLGRAQGAEVVRGLGDIASRLGGGRDEAPIVIVTSGDTVIPSRPLPPDWTLDRPPDGSLRLSSGAAGDGSSSHRFALQVRGRDLGPPAVGRVWAVPVPGFTSDPEAAGADTAPGTGTTVTIGDDANRFIDAADRAIVVGVVLASLLAGLATFLLARPVVGRATRLAAAARDIRSGDLDARVAEGASDELGDVAVAFNEMADGLQKSEALRQRLIGDVAHELRTPLTNLVGTLEAIQDGVMTPDPATLASMREEADLLKHLVQDLQEIAVAEGGGLTLDREPVDLGEVVGEVVRRLQANGTRRGVTVRMTAPEADSHPDALPVAADRRRIAQVVGNLLQNAVTHSPAGGEVVVGVVSDEREVRVTVTDQGPGIPAKQHSLIWNRFHRLDPARARDTGGAGLGLAIVKGLVEAHGGTVGVESTPGEGSTFTFILPRSTAD